MQKRLLLNAIPSHPVQNLEQNGWAPRAIWDEWELGGSINHWDMTFSHIKDRQIYQSTAIRYMYCIMFISSQAITHTLQVHIYQQIYYQLCTHVLTVYKPFISSIALACSYYRIFRVQQENTLITGSIPAKAIALVTIGMTMSTISISNNSGALG